MNNEIQVTNGNLPTIAAPQAVFTNSGDNGVQILNQGTINMYPANSSNALYNATTKISTEYYNLCVVEGESFNGHSFIIGKECALTMSEGVAPEISRRFAPLTAETRRDIETFPSLFANCNHQLFRAEIARDSILGLVKGIEVLDSSIKISFQGLCYIPRQRLIDLAGCLGIHIAAMSNEFDRAHWAIKRINLAYELRKAGFNLPAPL
jgi:hypothetical protein